MRKTLAVLAVSMVFGSAASAPPQTWEARPPSSVKAPTSPARVALVGGTVIDGTGGPPLADAVIVVEGERIQAVGRRGEVAIPSGARVINVTGKWVLPGFIDLHTHFTLAGYGPVDNSVAGRTLKALYYMNLYLRSGITAIRDTGSMPEVFQSLAVAQRDGALDSIRFFSTGRLITSKGGHGTESTMPGASRDATGPWDWRLAVRENFDAGFRYIKLSPTYTPEEIAAAVDEAKTLGMRVTTHAGGVADTWPHTSMTRIAVEAGTQCIEHLNQMDDDVLDLIARKGVYVVPTMTVLRELYRSGKIPKVLLSRGWTVQMHEDLFRKARKLKIVMGIGTDGTGRITPRHPELYPGFIGAAPNFYFDEMKYFVDLGVSPMETIVAATKNGALILGEESQLGTLAPGKQADLQVIQKNPLQSFDALGNPGLVMVGGRLHFFPSSQPDAVE